MSGRLEPIMLAAAVAAAIAVTGFAGAWPVALLQTSAFALVCWWLVYGARPASRHWLILPVAGLAGWGPAQLACGWSVYRFQTWQETLNRAACLALFFFALQAFRRERARKWFLAAAVYFAGALSILAILQSSTSDGRLFWLFETPYRDHVMGPFVAQNRYAAFVELTLPIALVAAARGRALLFGAIAGTMYASVVCTASRAGAVLATAELVLVLGFAARPRSWKTAGWVLVCAAVLCAVVGWGDLWRRFRDPSQYGFRWEFTQSSVEMTRARPWTGWGLGTWPSVYPAYARIDAGPYAVNRAHNDWVEWAAEGGLPFVAMMAAIAGWSVARACLRPWAWGVPVVFLHCAVDYPTREPALAAALFTLAGAAAARAPAGAPDSRLPANPS